MKYFPKSFLYYQQGSKSLNIKLERNETSALTNQTNRIRVVTIYRLMSTVLHFDRKHAGEITKYKKKKQID